MVLEYQDKARVKVHIKWWGLPFLLWWGLMNWLGYGKTPDPDGMEITEVIFDGPDDVPFLRGRA
jgi:hypothetical protein